MRRLSLVDLHVRSSLAGKRTWGLAHGLLGVGNAGLWAPPDLGQLWIQPQNVALIWVSAVLCGAAMWLAALEIHGTRAGPHLWEQRDQK
eukprot:1160409-Pelagomonas_calceolata.AAC.1